MKLFLVISLAGAFAFANTPNKIALPKKNLTTKTAAIQQTEPTVNTTSMQNTKAIENKNFFIGVNVADLAKSKGNINLHMLVMKKWLLLFNTLHLHKKKK